MIDAAVNNLLRSVVGHHRVTPSTQVVNLSEQLPRIVYTIIGGERGYNDSGPDGITPGVYQIDVFAHTATECRAILDKLARPATAAVEADRGLDGFKDEHSGTRIVRIYFPDQPRPGAIELQSGANSKIARMFREMRVVHR